MAILLVILFGAAQGGVIFLTAWGISRAINRPARCWRPILMLASWFGWCLLTLSGYFVMGGEGGLMDGMGMMLVLCVLALAATVIFAVGWTLRPARQLG